MLGYGWHLPWGVKMRVFSVKREVSSLSMSGLSLGTLTKVVERGDVCVGGFCERVSGDLQPQLPAVGAALKMAAPSDPASPKMAAPPPPPPLPRWRRAPLPACPVQDGSGGGAAGPPVAALRRGAAGRGWAALSFPPTAGTALRGPKSPWGGVRGVRQGNGLGEGYCIKAAGGNGL